MKQFKTQSKRILDLMINSIYTNKEIFLREIISKEFKKHQNQTRYNILENYFTNTLPTLKYKNKHRIINAVKSINVEMEEAQKEFSKLFQSNDYQK